MFPNITAINTAPSRAARKRTFVHYSCPTWYEAFCAIYSAFKVKSIYFRSIDRAYTFSSVDSLLSLY
jgi:hypothetical protein